jgi:hypothetical protein
VLDLSVAIADQLRDYPLMPSDPLVRQQEQHRVALLSQSAFLSIHVIQSLIAQFEVAELGVRPTPLRMERNALLAAGLTSLMWVSREFLCVCCLLSHR